MAWPFNKTPEVGADPKKQEDQSKAEMDAFLSQMKTSFEEIVKPIREKVEAVETNFNSLKESAERRTTTRTEDAREPADPTLEPERWKAETLGPLAMQSAQWHAETIEDRAMRNIPAEWRDVVEPQLQVLLSKNTPIERKVLPDYALYIENCMNLIIGQEARKAGLRRDPQNKRFFIEDAASGSNGNKSELGSELGWTDSKGNYHSPAETLSKLDIDVSEFSKGLS